MSKVFPLKDVDGGYHVVDYFHEPLGMACRCGHEIHHVYVIEHKNNLEPRFFVGSTCVTRDMTGSGLIKNYWKDRKEELEDEYEDLYYSLAVKAEEKKVFGLPKAIWKALMYGDCWGYPRNTRLTADKSIAEDLEDCIDLLEKYLGENTRV